MNLKCMRILALAAALVAADTAANGAFALERKMQLLPPKDHTDKVKNNPGDPESCSWLWEEIGLPVSRADEPPLTLKGDGKVCAIKNTIKDKKNEANSKNNDEIKDGPSHVEICHFMYIARHNNRTRTPDWVIQRTTRDTIDGDFKRPKIKFKQEGGVPVQCRGTNRHYTNSDFDRGHQTPSDDPERKKEWMKDTFYYSNAVPQVGAGFNSGVWSRFEAQVKHLVEAPKKGLVTSPPYDEIYVITGPIYQDSKGRKRRIKASENPCGHAIDLPVIKPKEICKANNIKTGDRKASCAPLGGVAVPSALYKIIYFPESGRYNAFILPNESHTKKQRAWQSRADYLDRWQVSVGLIEEYTGYDFFPDLDLREQRVNEDGCASFIRR